MGKLHQVIRAVLAAMVVVCLAAVAAPAQPAPAIPTWPPRTTSGGSGMALLNLDNTVALHGYDPVAYFTRDRAVKGSKRIIERLGGATYYFASSASRYTFLKNAPQYQPQLGGYCATSLARGQLQDINPKVFLIHEGKLYLFQDEGARAAFLNNPRQIIYQATQHYFELAQRQRRSY